MDKKIQYILERVTDLYQRYGIKSVTMDDVAHHLGISKKTLYEHFRNKEDLVEKITSLEHARQKKHLSGILRKKLNAIEELLEVYKIINSMVRKYNPSMEYDIRKYYPALFNRIREIRQKEMYASAVQNLVKGMKEGLYRKELNADVIARLHVSRFEYISENNLFSMEEITSKKVFHELFVYNIYGILNRKGREFFEKNFEKYRVSLT
jgi:AcrR family transcriptional regulator